jgi:DsbC/DsbD-like thiol-disulfide interchange protein
MSKHAFLPLAAILAAGYVLAVPVSAEAAAGPWVGAGKARVRLLIAGTDASGRLDGGIEIALDPGWHTYWRSPGDSGIAPVMDFSASRNLGPVEVAFPMPERVDDGYSVSNVYKGSVVLPISAKLGDAGSGADLSLRLDIGVCADVCVPDHFEATLALKPGESDAEVAKVLAEARGHLPGPPRPGTFAVTAVTRQGGTDKRPAFDIAATLPEVGGAAMFVEGPDDWYPDTPKLVTGEGGKATYRVTFDRLTSKVPITGTKLRVTIASGGNAIEQWVPLD